MMSTRSPGMTRPLTPATSPIGIEIARLPRGSTAARKPRSPGWTTAERAIGTPWGSAWRATEPSRTSRPRSSAITISSVTASSSSDIRARWSGTRIVPAASGAAGT
jgi:hypothetical protein